MNRDLRLRIEGALLERLLQRAADSGAVFASVSRINHRTIIVDCSESDANLLLALCEKYRLNCRILHRTGASALRRHIRSRLTLLAGLLLCALVCCFVLSRIWIIDIAFTGPNPGTGEQSRLLQCLYKMQVGPGMNASKLDPSLLQKQLMAETGNYSHIGVRRQGIRLLVEAAPEIPEPEVYDVATPRDLVSSMDGVVCSLNVKSGQACVTVGDTVRKGQLLVRGEEEKSGEETTAVGALANIYVRSWFEGRASGDLSGERIQRTGCTSTSSCIRLMGLSLPLDKGETFVQSETEMEIIPIGGLFLPVELIRQTRHETCVVQAENDRPDLQSRLSALARADALRHLTVNGPNAYEITDYWEQSIIEGNTLCIRTVFEITSDVAVSRDALIEEVNQSWKPADK